MNKIRLHNGEEYQVEYCGESERILSFRIPEAGTVPQAAGIFSDAAATCEITYLIPNNLVPDQPIVAAIYKGYTELIGVLLDRWDHRPTIQLTKGVS